MTSPVPLLCHEASLLEPRPRVERLVPQAAEPLRPLEFSILGADERTAAFSIWLQLEARLGAPLACSSDWTSAWLDAFGDLIPHRFMVALRDGQPVGIALLTEGVGEKVGPVAVRSVHVGTAGEYPDDSACIEYNAVLVEPEDRATFWRQLTHHLSKAMNWEQLHLDGFSPESMPACIASQAGVELRRSICRYFDLNRPRIDGKPIIEYFGHATRKSLRRSLKLFPAVALEWSETVEQAHAILDDLIPLHQARWNAAGMPGVYASPRFLKFHRELIGRLVPQGKMAFIRVRTEDRIIGCMHFFIDQNRVLVYQGGTLMADKGSAGAVVDYLAMEECLKRGYDAYDFLGGDNEHKRRFSNDATELIWATFRRPRLKFKAAGLYRRVRDLLRRWLRRPAPSAELIDEQESP